MNTGIPAALTLEEWRDVDSGTFDNYHMVVKWDDDLPKIAAIANRDLTDDSRYKITRADVNALLAEATRLKYQDQWRMPEATRAEALRSLADEFAARLPPPAA